MTIMCGPTRHLRVTILLVLVAFQSCINASDFPVINSPSMELASSFDENSVQHKRSLRARVPGTMDDVDDNPDERGINLGVATVTKFEGLTTAATQKWKKLVASAKTKISSNNQLTIDQRFKTFKVNTVNSDILLESVEFGKWQKFVKKAYKKNVEKGEVAMVRTLMKNFGDEDLAKLLREAKGVSSTKVIAEKLEDAQLVIWLTERKSVGDVFKLMKLDEAGETLFKSPQLSSWVKYANNFQSNPDESMFVTLKTHLDDQTLAKMIAAAKEDQGIHTDIAFKLEKVELEQWLKSGKTSEEAFKLLGLTDDTGNLLKNPTFNTWASYVTKADKQNPYDVVFAKLSTRYDDENMLKLISSAKQDSQTKRLAENLEMAQKNAWARDDKSPSDVFKLLSLQVEEGIDLLKSDKLRVWVSYVKQLKQNPDELLLNELKIRYNDENLARMLAMSKTDYHSRQAGERLERLLQNNWIGEDKTAQDIFKLMKLEREGESIFTSPMWSSWNSYLLKVSKGDPDESMYLVLRSQFGEEKLTRMIEAAKENRRTKNIADKLQEEIWRSEGKSADDIFKLLKLNEKKEKFFESPVLSTWISYVTKLEKLKEKPDGFASILYLEKKFGKVKLAHILAMEKKQRHVDTTKKVITDLQGMQFKRWMTKDGVDPKRLDLMLLDDTSHNVMLANVQVTLDFHDFYKANGGSPFYR